MDDWDDIRFFLAVARTGSTTAAARRLLVNHSTVSRRVAQLEERLGARLFDRPATGLMPTSAGNDLIEAAEQVELNVSRFSLAASARDGRLGGRLTVTAPPLLAAHLLMPMIGAFSSRHPEVEIELKADDAFASLTKREADVAIRATSAPQDALLGYRLVTNENALFCSHVYLSARGADAARVASRRDLDWIWFDPARGRPAWAADYFPDGRVAARVDTKSTALAAALAHLGVAELPIIVATAIPTLVRLPDLAVRSDRDVWILYHRDFRHTLRVQAFVADMRERFAALA